MKHLSKDEYLSALNITKKDKVLFSKYSKMYSMIIAKWNDPKDWFKDDAKIVYDYSFTSNKYWIIWSIKNKEKLPVEFIKMIMIYDSFLLVNNLLEDSETISEAINLMRESYSDRIVNQQYAIIMYMCIFKGIDKLKDITLEDIDRAYTQEGLFDVRYVNILKCFLYIAGYVNPEELEFSIIENYEMKRLSRNPLWSNKFDAVIENFLQQASNQWNAKEKMSSEKRSGIIFFLRWYSQETSNNNIQNLSNLNRTIWLKFIKYLNKVEHLSNKSKRAKAIAIRDFIEWIQLKEKSLVNKNKFINVSDLDSFKDHEKKGSKAFEKREYGERILLYLSNDFRSDDIRDKFAREAFLIAANSGARFSEIKMFEYGSCFYSEEEGLYKIILDYTDKTNQNNRPIYLTQAGYNAIKRVEKLREELSDLTKVFDKRRKRMVVRLFEYNGNQSILNEFAYKFLERVKIENNLVDKNEEPILGGFHSFRHFFGMTVFILSGYNISVVRYLLGHRNYEMSNQYLEEEKFKYLETQDVQKNSNNKYSGKGLDQLVGMIIDDYNKNNDFQKLLEGTTMLKDLINQNKIKKVGFGYCLNPCERYQDCIRCNNFLLSNDNQDELIDAVTDMFSLLCIKRDKFSNKDDFLSDLGVHNDIEELIILMKEIKNLGIESSRMPYELGGLYNDEIN